MSLHKTGSVLILALALAGAGLAVVPQVVAAPTVLQQDNGVDMREDYVLSGPANAKLPKKITVWFEFKLQTAKTGASVKAVDAPKDLKLEIQKQGTALLTNLGKEITEITKGSNSATMLEDINRRLVPVGNNFRKICDDTVAKFVEANNSKNKPLAETVYKAYKHIAARKSIDDGEDILIPTFGTYLDQGTEKSVAMGKEFKIETDVLSTHFKLVFEYEIEEALPQSLMNRVQGEFGERMLGLDLVFSSLKSDLNQHKLTKDKFLAELRTVLSNLGDECQKICDTAFNEWLRDHKTKDRPKNYDAVSKAKKTVVAYVVDEDHSEQVGGEMRAKRLVIPPQPGSAAKSDLAKQKWQMINDAVKYVLHEK